MKSVSDFYKLSKQDQVRLKRHIKFANSEMINRLKRNIPREADTLDHDLFQFSTNWLVDFVKENPTIIEIKRGEGYVYPYYVIIGVKEKDEKERIKPSTR